MRKPILFIMIIILALVVGNFAQPPKDQAQEKPPDSISLMAALTGAAEVPGPGDTDGGGTAKITLNQGKGEVCYELTVTNVAAPSAAHIHAGIAGQSGAVKVPLDAPANGSAKGCVNVDKDLLKDIMQNPANYYVNVHNAEFPQGAVRGQLGK